MAKEKEDQQQFLSPIQLGRLLPVIPSLLLLLREANPMACDLFLEGTEVSRQRIDFLGSELLNTLNFNGDLSMLELRFSFASYKTEIWLGLIREVLVQAWPRLIPDKIASGLLGCLTQLKDAQTPLDVAYILGPWLDRIPRTRFRVLAEFCAFIRDTSTSPEDFACLCGPFLLCPSVTLTTQGTSLIASQTAASAAICDMLIQEAAMLFGRVAEPTPLHPLGMKQAKNQGTGHRRSLSGTIMKMSFRSKGSAGPNAPPGLKNGSNKKGKQAPPPPPRRGAGGSSLGRTSTNTAASSSSKTSNKKAASLEEKRKLGLRVFYQFRDPRRADRVEILFQNYAFEEIALAIQRKYYLLPPGWKEQLEYMLLTGNRNLGWFARLKQGILPAPVEQEQDKEKEGEQKETKIDKVINEIADTESHFNRTLTSLNEQYANRVKAIAEGFEGTAAQKSLGLNSQQVEAIFGQRLAKVVEVSNTLLSDLEVVTLVRVQPKSGKSRIELISRVFMELSQQLYVFSPYSCGHKTAVTYLRQARAAFDAPPQQGVLRRLGSVLGGETQKNYMELWEEASSQSPELRGQTLESILIMPIQRIPRYKLLLEELRKATPKTDPCYLQLCEVCEIIKTLAVDMNESIRQHERLMKKFGDDFVAPQAAQGKRNLY